MALAKLKGGYVGRAQCAVHFLIYFNMRAITLLVGLVILAISVYSLNVDEFSDQNVFERELVTDEIKVKSILAEHDKPSKNIGEKNLKALHWLT